MSPSHVSRTIDRAEADGLVARETDPDDRRASQVVLAEAGRVVLAEFAPLLAAVIDDVIGGSLNSREVDTLVALLRRVEDAATAT